MKALKDKYAEIMCVAVVLLTIGALAGALIYPASPESIYPVNPGCYITYDTEGDWLLWDTKPRLEDRVWMPPKDKDFNCTSISFEAADILRN